MYDSKRNIWGFQGNGVEAGRRGAEAGRKASQRVENRLRKTFGTEE